MEVLLTRAMGAPELEVSSQLMADIAGCDLSNRQTQCIPARGPVTPGHQPHELRPTHPSHSILVKI